MIPRLLLGLVFSSAIGTAAYRRESLSRSGVIGAILTGTITFTAGFGWAAILILFFVTSSLLSHMGEARKAAARAQFSKGEQRDFWQVMANGGWAALVAILYIITENNTLWPAYLGALATANADTWATEIGTMSRRIPRLMTTLKPVDPGTSGGVTLDGTLAGLAAAALIGLVGIVFEGNAQIFVAVVIGGIAGSLFDSLLGATVQALYWCADRAKLSEKATCVDGSPAELRKGIAWMNNEVVNFSATVVGSLIGWILAGL